MIPEEWFSYIVLFVAYGFPLCALFIYSIFFSSHNKSPGLILVMLLGLMPLINWIIFADCVEFNKHNFNQKRFDNIVYFLPVLMLGLLWLV